MSSFFFNNPFGRILGHILICTYEVVRDFWPEIVMKTALGENVNWRTVFSSPAFVLTIIANCIFALVAQAMKYDEEKETKVYDERQMEYYIDQSTQIALDQMRKGEHRKAKKTIALQERHVTEMKRR